MILFLTTAISQRTESSNYNLARQIIKIWSNMTLHKNKSGADFKYICWPLRK